MNPDNLSDRNKEVLDLIEKVKAITGWNQEKVVSRMSTDRRRVAGWKKNVQVSDANLNRARTLYEEQKLIHDANSREQVALTRELRAMIDMLHIETLREVRPQVQRAFVRQVARSQVGEMIAIERAGESDPPGGGARTVRDASDRTLKRRQSENPHQNDEPNSEGA